MSDINRIAIVGCGSMGTLLGACLTSKGVDVQMVDADTSIVEAVRKNGLAVTGQVDIHLPVKICTPDDLEGEFDLIILLTKQTHNQVVLPCMKQHLSADGVFVTLQNGIPEYFVAEYIDADQVMGCAVTWAATLIEPGVTCSTTKPEDWHNSLGTLDGRTSGRIEDVYAVLSKMCATEISDNLMGVRWSKLMVNSSFSGMSAALGCTFGEVLEHPEALRCAQYAAMECVETAKAMGIQLVPLSPGEEFDKIVPFHSEAERESTTWLYQKLLGASYDGKASMLQDLLQGRKTEIDYIDGAVCRSARQIGVEVPYCDAIVSVVKAIEAGERTPDMKNLEVFPS